MRYWDFSACKNIQETRSWVRILAKTTSPDESIAWAVAEKDSDNCIGMVNYHHREPLNRGWRSATFFDRNGTAGD